MPATVSISIPKNVMHLVGPSVLPCATGIFNEWQNFKKLARDSFHSW